MVPELVEGAGDADSDLFRGAGDRPKYPSWKVALPIQVQIPTMIGKTGLSNWMHPDSVLRLKATNQSRFIRYLLNFPSCCAASIMFAIRLGTIISAFSVFLERPLTPVMRSRRKVA